MRSLSRVFVGFNVIVDTHKHTHRAQKENNRIREKLKKSKLSTSVSLRLASLSPPFVYFSVPFFRTSVPSVGSTAIGTFAWCATLFMCRLCPCLCLLDCVYGFTYSLEATQRSYASPYTLKINFKTHSISATLQAQRARDSQPLPKNLISTRKLHSPFRPPGPIFSATFSHPYFFFCG